MARWMAALILGAGLMALHISPVSAQATPPGSLDKLEVDLWPEYDRAAVLVIDHIFMPNGTTFPASLTIRIPTTAGDPFNLAFRHTDGQLYNLTYNRKEDGVWSDITFSSPTAEVQLEYYDTALSKEGTNRSYTFTWPGSYAIKTVLVQVQQPAGATDMRITPAAGNPVPGAGGLVYYTAEAGSINPNQSFSYQVSYQKQNDDLSVQNGKVAPAAPINASTPGRATLGSLWWILLVFAALLLIAGGSLWYLRSMRGAAPQPARRRHIPVREHISEPSGADSIYCHQCGKRASAGDVFCRSCGTRLRREDG